MLSRLESIERMRGVRSRRAALIGVLVIATGGAFAGVRVLLPQHRVVVVSQPLMVGSLPTVAHPLPLFAKQTTLASAQAALGSSLVLPQTAVVGPSEAGAVWTASQTEPGGATTTVVAVTFPAQGMIIEYENPAPLDGSAATFQSMTKSMPSRSGGSEGQVITLAGGVPALAVAENSDDLGTNFGEIIFNVGGTQVQVMGHNDEATLQPIAESVLARASH